MRYSLILKCVLFWSCLLTTLFSAHAYDFEVDGFNYTITSPSKLEVKLAFAATDDIDITVPSTVNWQNRTYSVLSIGEYAFRSVVQSVVIPEGVRELEQYAFYARSNCKSVELPNSLEVIGKSAFVNCTNLTKIVLPNKLCRLENYAFGGCAKLSEVFFCGEIAPTYTDNQDQVCSWRNANIFNSCHPYIEFYVPSAKNYGFGTEYLSGLDNNRFTYTGKSNEIKVTNNLGAYDCEIENAQTEIDAGTYKKMIKAVYSNGVDFTVNIPFEYAIAGAPLTAQVDDATRHYGDANPAFNCRVEGFVNNESLDSDGISLSYECVATAGSPVGEYPIRAAVNAKNYDVTYTYGKLTVEKAPLTMSTPNVSRVYGENNLEFDIVYQGLKNNEQAPEWSSAPTVSTTATRTSPVGDYDIVINGGVAPNYEITAATGGKLIVTKKDAVVKANNYTRVYGEENPAFECSYAGLIAGESDNFLLQQPTIETAATRNSPVGTYEIVAKDAAAKNYNFTYEKGALTIVKAPQQITWDQTFENVKPEDVVELTAKSTSGLPIEYSSLKPSVASIELQGDKAYVRFIASGEVTIKAGQTGDANHEAAEDVYANVTVWQNAESLALNEAEIKLAEYDSFTLTATVMPATTTQQEIAWASSDEAVATVSGGIVRALSQGHAIITATTTDGTNLSATCSVTVIKPVAGIIAEPTQIELEVGKSTTIVAAAVPANATNTALVWTSDDETIATVNQSGLVTAVAEGNTRIIISAADESGVEAVCAVTVTPLKSGISEVAVDSEKVSVFTTDGRCILRDATQSELAALRHGIYILRYETGRTDKIAIN